MYNKLYKFKFHELWHMYKLWNYYYNQDSYIFISSKTSLWFYVIHLHATPLFTDNDLFPFWYINLHFLEFYIGGILSYVFLLFGLLSFTQHNYVRFNHVAIQVHSLFFYYRAIFHWVGISPIVYPFTSWLDIGLFPLFRYYQ